MTIESTPQTRSTVVIIGSVLFAIAAAWMGSCVNTERLREREIAACHRHNIIREHVNENGDRLAQFLHSAAQVRVEQAALQREQGDNKGASINEKIATKWNDDAKEINPITLTNCVDAFR